jgi:Na+-translocating ferredoxin:NAD+ oxidoreductase RnfD subunit
MEPGVDAVSAATPLYVLKHYGISAVMEKFGTMPTIYKDFFVGWRPGCIGETSALLLLLGGFFLIYKRYITWHIPVSVILSGTSPSLSSFLLDFSHGFSAEKSSSRAIHCLLFCLVVSPWGPFIWPPTM